MTTSITWANLRDALAGVDDQVRTFPHLPRCAARHQTTHPTREDTPQ